MAIVAVAFMLTVFGGVNIKVRNWQWNRRPLVNPDQKDDSGRRPFRPFKDESSWQPQFPIESRPST